jgi:hypothetical protein
LLHKLALAFTISTLYLRVLPRAEDLKFSQLKVGGAAKITLNLNMFQKIELSKKKLDKL